MERLIIIDSAIRLLAIGQLLLMALVIGRGRAPRPIRAATVALLLGVCAYLAVATPILLHARGPFWGAIQLAAQSTPLLLWVFAHLLFDRPLNRWAMAGGIIILFGCWIGFGLAGPIPNSLGLWCAIIQRVTSLALTIHAILIAYRERGDDLIEKRRRLRVGFVIVVGVLAVMVLVVEMIFGFRHTGAVVTLPQAVAVLLATMAMGAALLQSDPDLLFDPSAPAEPPPAPTLSPSEHVLKQKLDAIMAGGIHRETGLTIGQLAQRLSVPEHRLRALINQRLGYRNFSAFLNHHRIAEAKAMLADPAHVDLPILTIAMDLGYGSLAPFNRAFREEAGQAPSDYRRRAFAEKS
ncbi:MAG: helix-turn-helix domain-containing protein [Sphingomonas sp.]|nr:helix-turn-helix domain-containing protein [Sphingomonas sp.]